MKVSLRPVVSAAALLSVFLFSCSKETRPNRAPVGQEKPRPVKTVRAEWTAMERAVAVTGSLAAKEQADLSVKVPGRLQAFPVDIGSVVRAGDLIAQLERRDYELRLKQAIAAVAQARAVLGLPLDGTNDQLEPEKLNAVEQAKATLDEAAKNRERARNLSEEGITSKSELDAAETILRVASNRYQVALEEARTRQAVLVQRRVELDIAQQQLSDTAIHAPFDGAIQARNADWGEYLPAGAPVVTLVKTDPLRLRLEVPERESANVRVGQLVRLAVEGHTNAYTGKIARLSPAIDEQKRTLLVEADVPNHGLLRPGLFTRASIITTDRDGGLAVPLSTLITFAGLEKVLVVQDGKAREKTVSTGRRTTEWVEILSGIQPGAVVVLDPGNLRTGQLVTIEPTEVLQTNKEVSTSGP